jgi:excisionase family DNA binding protein
VLSVKEVATQLKVSKATIYRLIASGDLEAVRSGRPRTAGSQKRGGAIRVPEHALEAHRTRSVG